MKVVHICNTDAKGGAAIAAFRLHLAMLTQGINSRMLVMHKQRDDITIEAAKKNQWEKNIFSKYRVLREIIQLKKYDSKISELPFSTGCFGLDISTNTLIQEADIINLHWINGGYLSLEGINKLKKLNKKIIWTLHDSWPFTGGCHVRYDCEKYKKKCGSCFILKSNKDKDLSRQIWKRKYSVYKNSDIKIVTPSKWLGNCAKNSSLFNDKDIRVIPNTLDLNIYKINDKRISKKILNLDDDKLYISFGAINATTTPYKGFKYLQKAIVTLQKKYTLFDNKIELLVFGSSFTEDIGKLPFNVKFLGQINDEYTLSLIYNASDVFLAPSLEDNLPNTVMESLSCGTPVVAFNVGGIPDLVEHKKNGYLAKYKDSEELAEGILWCLENNSEGILSDYARKKVELNFSNSVVVRQYKELYEQ